MKRYVKCEVSYSDAGIFDNYSDWNSDIRDYFRSSDRSSPNYQSKNFTDAGLLDCYQHDSEFLYRLRQFSSRKEFNVMKSRLKDMVDTYDYQLHKIDIYVPLKNMCYELTKLLKVPGLSYKIGREALQVYYTADTAKYSIDSNEFHENVDELTRCFESIPSVAKVTYSELSNGRHWYLYLNVRDMDDVRPTYVPGELNKLTYSEGISYKITYVTGPIYRSNLRFQTVEGSDIMYMTSSETSTISEDTPQNLYDEIFRTSRIVSSWNELFNLLDSIDYKTNGAIITNTSVLKIVRISNGKSKTIYSRKLPTVDTVVLVD